MKIKIGDLRHRIEICDWVQSPEGETDLKNSRIPVAEVWAKVENVNPYKINHWRIDQDAKSKSTHVLTIRELCDYELTPKHWIYRSYKGRDEWFRVLATSDIEESFHCYTRILAALWVRDSERLDPEIQDVPCEDIEPNEPVSFDYRDLM